MQFSTFLACTILPIISLADPLESNETSFSTDYSNAVIPMDEMHFFSQASQDKFVYSMLYGLLGKQDQGFYLEIGAGEPIHINNSYFFEKNLHWNGVSIDISDNLAPRWYDVRKNLLLTENALKSDYASILRSFPKIIDYLSLDVDEHYSDVLKKIPFSDHIFKIITIEHDFYRYGDLYRQQERQILMAFGYHLLCSDVSDNGLSFEDWWIHPSFFSSSELAKLESFDLKTKDHRQLIRTIQTITIKNPLRGFKLIGN